MKKQSLISIIILIIASIIVGFFIGKYLGYKNGYEQAWETAKEKLRESKVMPPSPEKVLSIGGKIIKVENKIIYIKAEPVSINPLEDQGPAERKVIITDLTQIAKKTAKTPTEIQKEMSERVKAGIVSPPEPYIEETVNFSDLKVNDRISVSAQENIKYKEEFEAETIFVLK